MVCYQHAFVRIPLQAASLEAALFGKDESALHQLGTEADAPIETRFGSSSATLGLSIFTDRAPAPTDDQKSAAAGAAIKSARQPAWEDPDDDAVHINVAAQPRLRKLRQTEEETELSGADYQNRLRRQHRKLNPRADWASLDRAKPDADVADALLLRAGGLLAGSRTLPPGRIEMTRLKDGNYEEPNQSVVRSVEFHPNGQLMMTAGLDKRLRFFSIDGVLNPHVQSIYLEDSPIQQAGFAAGGAHIIAAGRRAFFYVVDLESAKVERIVGIFGRQERSFESFATSPAASTVAFFGRDGNIPLVSTSSRQAIGNLKMNGTVRAGAFSPDGQQLLTSGGDGTVYVWDLRTQRCLRRYVDEGSTGGTSLAMSPQGNVFASGSQSGVVNVYRHPTESSVGGAERTADVPAAPLALRPIRALPHLVTTADSLAFSPDGQLLAMASRMKRDALTLVHVPTLTAFSNWPTSRSPLHYVHSLAFSPGGGYLAIGNAKGRVLLYRLHHYAQA
jgi:U3 small nucleolar RNA-associated protein 18